MSMSISITKVGVPFAVAGAAAAAKAAAVVAKAAFDIESGAKSRAPVDTGLLKNSIEAVEEDKLEWVVEVHAEYGAYVEFGTRYTAAQPFLTPAVEEVRPVFLAAMARIT